tara:strand:+ start:311 stop:1267 length:957 start_codon:yes stop_codon:yes gene_type:complete
VSGRKPINLEKLCPKQRAKIEASGLSPEDLMVAGDRCKYFIEPVPEYDDATSEIVKKNSHNAWIVLGRDRPAGPETGYGGLGHTAAGAIDIVVGRMGGAQGGPDCNRQISANFVTDSARVFISQKTDIDKNFGLVGEERPEGVAGIGIKADAVRIVGRQGVKIVTGKAKNFDGLGKNGELNGQGEVIEDGDIVGIELIAGNDVSENSLEPIVKAYALAETLEVIVEMISSLANIVNENAMIQTQLNLALAVHTHQVSGVQAWQSGDLCVNVANKEANKMSSVHSNLYKHKLKLGVANVNTRLSQIGPKWFGSRYNKTN